MTLSKARFTTKGCLLTIDGWEAAIEAKSSLIAYGVCWVSAVLPEDEPKADALRISPCGQDGNVFGCADPQLVELASRYNLWLDDVTDGTEELKVEPLEPVAAAIALQQRLANLNA